MRQGIALTLFTFDGVTPATATNPASTTKGFKLMELIEVGGHALGGAAPWHRCACLLRQLPAVATAAAHMRSDSDPAAGSRLGGKRTGY